MGPPPAKKQKLVEVSADSLDEDFLLEDSFAPSDLGSGDDEEDAALHLAVDIESDSDGQPPRPPPVQIDVKKRKGAKQEKSKEAKRAKVLEALEETARWGTLPPESLADRLAEKQKKALPKLSTIEMDDIRINASMILDTSHVEDRKSLFSFIRASVATLPSTLAKPPKKAGAPRVLVIAGAALRVADLCREVKPYKTKDIDVAKLFAKHFKITEHVEYLNKTKVGIAVGTPGRIGKLLSETDALLLTHLSHLVLDVSHHNTKNQSLLDMFECREDLFRLVLGNKDIMQRLRDGRMKIVFF